VARVLWLAVLLVAFVHPIFAQTVSSEMDAGIAAYKSDMYESAIGHFRKAIELYPNLVAAHLYLALACAQMYIPGSESPDDLQLAENSLAEFKRVLELSPPPAQRMMALKGLASLNFNLKRFNDARDYDHQIVQLDPRDAAAYFSLGLVGWTEAYTARMDLRQSIGLRPGDQLNSLSACHLLRSLNQEKVEDAIHALQEAIDLRCDYDDAMAYLNLMYREKADYECDDAAARAADLKLADQWIDRTMEVKKAKAEKATAPH